jgi:hypothetical protein
MNNLFIDADGNYPRFMGDVQLIQPSFQLGDSLPDGWLEVAETDRPTAGDNQVVEPADPIELNGVWTQQWKVRNLTESEIEKRNAPSSAREKLVNLGFTELEVEALISGLIR